MEDLRIKVKDFDTVANLIWLEDIEGMLSPLVISVDKFDKWRIDQHRGNLSRTQLYMTFIKNQGGKQTIYKQIEQRRNDSYYEGFVKKLGDHSEL